MSGQPREDFLEEDPEIRSQKFVLLSFLSPENVLANKDQFFFGEFLKQYEIDYKLRNLETFLVSIARGVNDKLTAEADRLENTSPDLSGAADVCRKSRLNLAGMLETYHNYVRENDKATKKTAIKEAYEDFLFKNQAKLEDEFFAKNDFHTTIRGLKVRGVYGAHGEAVAGAKKLQRNDPIHNIFVGEVGKWLPWDPKPSQVQEQEYAEDQLNQLMKRYKDNEDAKEKFVTEQRQAGRTQKKAVMGSDGAPVTEGAGASSEGWGSMFDGPADLAMARKQQSQAPVTISRVEEDAPKDTVVSTEETGGLGATSSSS
jgi:hypothetical protein